MQYYLSVERMNKDAYREAGLIVITEEHAKNLVKTEHFVPKELESGDVLIEYTEVEASTIAIHNAVKTLAHTADSGDLSAMLNSASLAAKISPVDATGLHDDVQEMFEEFAALSGEALGLIILKWLGSRFELGQTFFAEEEGSELKAAAKVIGPDYAQLLYHATVYITRKA